mmetsp:Transcript_55950/g.147961  ORF Transcript_55950/g.147961 Transcript_55950/m.147961 type:complete len:126 (+) Transcript_55950:460-837(+)
MPFNSTGQLSSIGTESDCNLLFFPIFSSLRYFYAQAPFLLRKRKMSQIGHSVALSNFPVWNDWTLATKFSTTVRHAPMEGETGNCMKNIFHGKIAFSMVKIARYENGFCGCILPMPETNENFGVL